MSPRPIRRIRLSRRWKRFRDWLKRGRVYFRTKRHFERSMESARAETAALERLYAEMRDEYKRLWDAVHGG